MVPIAVPILRHWCHEQRLVCLRHVTDVTKSCRTPVAVRSCSVSPGDQFEMEPPAHISATCLRWAHRHTLCHSYLPAVSVISSVITTTSCLCHLICHHHHQPLLSSHLSSPPPAVTVISSVITTTSCYCHLSDPTNNIRPPVIGQPARLTPTRLCRWTAHLALSHQRVFTRSEMAVTTDPVRSARYAPVPPRGRVPWPRRDGV